VWQKRLKMAGRKILVDLSLLTYNELNILILFLSRDNSYELGCFKHSLEIERSRRDRTNQTDD
jgi:hypothetical protein